MTDFMYVSNSLIPGIHSGSHQCKTLEIEKRKSEVRTVIGMLSSGLMEQNYPSRNQKNLCTRLQSKVFYYMGQKHGH
jgi:hypothetical protein